MPDLVSCNTVVRFGLEGRGFLVTGFYLALYKLYLLSPMSLQVGFGDGGV